MVYVQLSIANKSSYLQIIIRFQHKLAQEFSRIKSNNQVICQDKDPLHCTVRNVKFEKQFSENKSIYKWDRWFNRTATIVIECVDYLRSNIDCSVYARK